MSTPSQAIQAGNASHSTASGGNTARGKDTAPAGLENLFARIAADMEAQEPAEITPGTDAESTIDQTAAAGSMPLATEEVDTDQLLPLIAGDNAADETGDLQTTGVTTAITDPTTAPNRGLQHAATILAGMQSARTQEVSTLPGSGSADPLTHALRALQQAGKPESLPENAAEPAKLNHTQIIIAPEVEITPDAQSLRQSPVTMEQLQQAIQKTVDGLVIKPELQAAEAASGNHQNTVVSQSGASNQTLLRADGSTVIVKMDIPGSIHQPAWQQALAERVVFAAGQNIKQAEIQLHPAELGSVNIRIEASNDRAAVQFTAMNADTREALDAALPRLREMFNQQGIDLVRADVQQNNANDQDTQAWQSGLFSESEPDSQVTDAAENIPGPINRPANPDGIVDIYA